MMNYIPDGPHEECHNDYRPNIDIASKCAGIDLSKPIDISQMTVLDAATNIVEDYRGRYSFETTSRLFTTVVNEYGEEDELYITIKRKSKRRPIIKPG